MTTRKPPRTIGVLGVRDFEGTLYSNKEYVTRTFELHLRKQGFLRTEIGIVTGGAQGVERMIVEWCKEFDVPYRAVPPNLEDYSPKRAFTIRNNHVVSASDELVVFWDGNVRITSNAIATAALNKKQATVYPLV